MVRPHVIGGGTANVRQYGSGNKLPGQVQMEVMRAVEKLQDNAFGAEIHIKVEEALGRSVQQPQIFTALSRLCKRGFLENHRSGTIGRSPVIKFFRLTDKGYDALGLKPGRRKTTPNVYAG